ncbi:winged helix DNA-binding domain-containing protein [Neobacillus mesonae]|uniref:winged helix DNA-binding domain-containing protein n=1 Tax=Neobacillus mesonae TaxID=1193713 RepID=UPI0008317E6B|nr:winged helix DNA-binding domain-containing protein [Neobacillus mesonae]
MKSNHNHESQNRVMSPRALNRTLLARQLLIKRSNMSIPEALEHLIGIQSQTPNSPYVSLWTRVDNFKHETLSQLLLNRDAVRIALMRSTIFLVTKRDCLALRPLIQPVLDRTLKANFGRRLTDVDNNELAKISRDLVESQPCTLEELGKLLKEKWEDTDPSALAAAARNLVPLVQTPPRGIWGAKGKAIHTSAENWLCQSLVTNYNLESLILRYLNAFGPATISDIQTWSGLTKIRKVIEGLRLQLNTFFDEDGNELFDVSHAEFPDIDTPVPVRFLAEFDNILLSHKNRSRILADEYRSRVFTVNGIIKATFLIDGYVQGLWRIEQKRKSTTLIIEPFKSLLQVDKDELAIEGAKLMDFAVADSDFKNIQFWDPI